MPHWTKDDQINGSDHASRKVCCQSLLLPTLIIFQTRLLMFGLIRRISYSVIPRPDRPWEDDRAFRFLHNVRVLIRNAFFFAFLATSNAPHKSKKRRMSASEEPEPDMEQANKKKVRGESSTPSVADSSEVHVRLSTPLPQPETQEVKEVTQGVKDVELEIG